MVKVDTSIFNTTTTKSSGDSLSFFRMALEAAVVGRYGDWLRLFTRFKPLILQRETSLSVFDKRIIRWVETKGRTLGCEEKDRRSTMLAFGGDKPNTEKTREELLFHFLDVLDDWSAKVGHLLAQDEQVALSLRNDALSKLKLLEWADVKTITRIVEMTKADTRRLEETEASLYPKHRLPNFYR